MERQSQDARLSGVDLKRIPLSRIADATLVLLGGVAVLGCLLLGVGVAGTSDVLQPIREHLGLVLGVLLVPVAGGALLWRSRAEGWKRQEQQLLAMTKRLAVLQEAERRDLARELHDRVGQNLAMLSVNLERLRVSSAGRDSAARIADCMSVVETTGLVIQDVLTELKPPMLATYGLLDAVRWHAREFTRRTGIEVEATDTQPEQRLSPEVEMALFRIAQAALNNVAQHARAKSVQISLGRKDDRATFRIRDDGAGFDAAQAMTSGSWGLAAMRERAEAIGGELRIDSAHGRGAEVVVELGAAP